MKHVSFGNRLAMGIAVIFYLATTAQAADFSLENLGDGIYVHHGEHLDIDTGYQGDIANISFVVGSRGVAVIDTGGSLKVGRQLRASIKAVTQLPILYVINTHVHPDHVFGNAAFLQDKPIFVGHAKLADTMQLRQEAYAKLNVKYLGADAEGSFIVKPSLTVVAGSKLDLGDRSLELTPYASAHTVTDISLIDSKTRTLFTGDLLFIERTPVIESDIKGLIEAIDSLKTSSISQVVPGHGPCTKDWIAALNNERRYLDVLLTDIRTKIKNGVSMETTMDTAAASEKDKWLLFEVANRRNVNTLYPLLEWE